MFKDRQKAASVSSGVGSLVWVEDQDVAWMDGEVLAVSGDDVKVLCTSGNTREGLSNDEGANRLQIFGPNKLEEKIEAVVIATGEIEAVVIEAEIFL
ncbi:hypothetical protein LIER_33215 [Lithospermum erythrorhizon]|uniref:Myosin N-terminal SH3-like domain-containing protein n=1 Tax=Lithospermum erythrorhizon TaxID=34254 RepID=A0AAV3S040_LITER